MLSPMLYVILRRMDQWVVRLLFGDYLDDCGIFYFPTFGPSTPLVSISQSSGSGIFLGFICLIVRGIWRGELVSIGQSKWDRRYTSFMRPACSRATFRVWHSTFCRPLHILSHKYLRELECSLISPNSHQQGVVRDWLSTQTFVTLIFALCFSPSLFGWGNEGFFFNEMQAILYAKVQCSATQCAISFTKSQSPLGS